MKNSKRPKLLTPFPKASSATSWTLTDALEVGALRDAMRTRGELAEALKRADAALASVMARVSKAHAIPDGQVSVNFSEGACVLALLPPPPVPVASAPDAPKI